MRLGRPGSLLRMCFYSTTTGSDGSGSESYHLEMVTNKLLDANTLYQLDRYSRYNPASISIKHLLDHGKHSSTHNSFLFLKKEIPTRLANMIMELQLLPPTLRKQKECNQILNDYISSFRDLLQFEIKKGDKEDLESFTDSLNMIRRRHLDTVPLMAQAVIKMSHINQSEGVTDTVQYFLDRLYTNRISIHMLVSHYNALLGTTKTVTGMVGTIDQKCDILGVCLKAYTTAANLCDREYMDHPELVATALDTSDENIKTQEVVSASYVPSHLHHIMFEIFKNAMRATCEFSEAKGNPNLPPIKVKIYKTRNDITIKISDLGGGIPRMSSGKVFNYMYSTAPRVDISESGGSYGAGISSDNLPMHGLGYGLPLSRLYARYFKGDLQIASVHGYGTNVYVYLQRLSHMAQENIPVYNTRSSSRLKNIATQVPDWTDDKGF